MPGLRATGGAVMGKGGVVRRTLTMQQISRGVVVNEALFGGYESLQDALKSGIAFNVDFDRYYVCLTGIPRQLFSGRLHKSLDNFIEVYGSWRTQVSEYLHRHGIATDIAVVKYDQSKRICCIMSGFSDDENGSASSINARNPLSNITPLRAAHFMHLTLARLYELLWDVTDSECPFVTALSDSVSGFDALSATFAQVDVLSRLSFFWDRSRVLTSEMQSARQIPIKVEQLDGRLRSIERNVLTMDMHGLEDALRGLFFKDLRYSFDFWACDYAIQGLRQIVTRCNSVYGAGIDDGQIRALGIEGRTGLSMLYDEVLSLLEVCVRASNGKGLGTGPISLEAIRYLKLHFAEPCTIKEIADHVGVSPNYLSRVFNREVGENISSYLARLRLRRAAVLLETTSDSVSTVGARTGFANASYFSTAFRQYFGMSPLEYRGRAVGLAWAEEPDGR